MRSSKSWPRNQPCHCGSRAKFKKCCGSAAVLMRRKREAVEATERKSKEFDRRRALRQRRLVVAGVHAKHRRAHGSIGSQIASLVALMAYGTMPPRLETAHRSSKLAPWP